MRGRKIFIIIGILLISSLYTYAQTHVYVEGLIDFTKNKADTFTLDVNIENVSDLSQFEFKLTFGTIINVQAVSLGTAFSGWYDSKNIFPGYIKYGALSLDSSTFSGSTTLASITFSIKRSGTTSLKFEYVKLYDSNLALINCTYSNSIFCSNANSVMAFTMRPGNPMAGEEVIFDATDSFDPDGGRISDYKWYIKNADGLVVAEGNNPILKTSFGSAGTYYIDLEIYDEKGCYNMVKLVRFEVAPYSVPPEGSPVASFTMTPEIVMGETEVTFDASNSYDPDGDELTYEWVFGDGQTAKGKIVTHSFAVGYNYTYQKCYFVKLIVTDSYGNSSYIYKPLIANKRPLVTITPSPLIPETDIAYDASGLLGLRYINGLEDAISNVTWNNAPSSYPEVGIYNISLAIEDTQGNSSILSLDITVYPPINVEFIINPAPPYKPWEEITFDASGIIHEPDIVKYEWDLGDGNIAWGTTVTHVYSKRGKYTVTLTCVDEDSIKSSLSKEVQIGYLRPFLYVSSDSCLVGEEIIFDASLSKSDVAIVRYEWNFGDGKIAEGVTVTHVYYQAGSFLVTLKLTDEYGLTASISKLIKVEEHPPKLLEKGCGLLGVELILLVALLIWLKKVKHYVVKEG